MIRQKLRDGHTWLRIVRPDYLDPFDMTFARDQGGRWNPPGSWPTLYANEDMATVHGQVRHMFVGRGIDPDDLDDDAPLHLAACTLPQRQSVAAAYSTDGLAALSLPAEYPVDWRGQSVARGVTQAIGASVHADGLRGVWCTSAAGVGREIAWFPAGSSTARPAWTAPKPFGDWRYARHLRSVS